MDVVRGFPDRVARRPERYAMPEEKSVAEVKAELESVLASELSAAGAGNNGDIWSVVEPEAAAKNSVFDGVAEFTRVCAYDRPGTIAGSPRSRSDPAPMPRSAGDIVADLRALLVAAGVRPPYVLVGPSFGGLVVRLFASTVPDEVVGLVLVDAAQEEFWTRLKALVTPEQWKGMITGTPPELADYRDFEKLDVDASAAEMRRAAAARPLRPLPLIVLSRGLPMELSPDMSAKLPANFSAEQERIWQNCQDELVALVPGAQHVVATNNETIADALGQSSPGMAMHYAKEADLRKKMTGVVRRFDRRMNKAATKAVKPTD